MHVLHVNWKNSCAAGEDQDQELSRIYKAIIFCIKSNFNKNVIYILLFKNMKLFSLAVFFAAVQSISACGRIYGVMDNMIAADSYHTVMFDGCSDRCNGSSTGSGWSYDTVANIPCNSGYKLQMTHNGHEAYFTTPWGRFDLRFGTDFSKTVCGVIKDHISIYCTTYAYDCWAFTDNCNGCGGYKAGSSPKCVSWNGMSKRDLLSTDKFKDPNPAWAYNKSIAQEMVKNGTLQLKGPALEIHNHNQRNAGKLQSACALNMTALHEKYFGSAK